MALRDEVREQRAKLKNEPFSKKLSYYLDYYKWPLILIIIAVIALIYFIYQINQSSREESFYGIFLNVDTTYDDSSIISEFTSDQNIDVSKNPFVLENSLSYRVTSDGSVAYADVYTPAKLQVLQSEKELDVIIVDVDTLANLASKGFLTDLNAILTPEVLNNYQDILYYYEYTDDTTGVNMSVPVGFTLNESRKLISCGINEGKEYIYCICPEPPHLDITLAFLNYLLD